MLEGEKYHYDFDAAWQEAEHDRFIGAPGLQYNLEHAAEEALKMQELIREGRAKDYEDAGYKVSPENYKEFTDKLEPLYRTLKEKYNIEKVPHQLEDQLYFVNKIFGGIENIKGKRVLDIGCGSVLGEKNPEIISRLDQMDFAEANRRYGHRGISEDVLMHLAGGNFRWKDDYRTFEPWFCRALKELEADPVGIDIGILDGEVFEHYTADLSKKGALDFLSDKSFDAVNMRLFMDSPELQRRASRMGIDEVRQEMKQQIKRLLKDGGRTIVLTLH